MPSFDIVSEPNTQEVKNAIEQANKEVSTRFDFKGTDARFELKEFEITAYAESVRQTLTLSSFSARSANNSASSGVKVFSNLILPHHEMCTLRRNSSSANALSALGGAASSTK